MKKIIIALSIVVAAATSHATYLFWQVNPAESDTIASATKWNGGTESGYDYASLWVRNDSTKEKTKLAEYRDGATTQKTDIEVLPGFGMTDNVTVDVSAYENNKTAYSFYIELASSKLSPSKTVATSQAMTYVQLQEAGSIQATSTLEDIPAATVWHGGTYSAAPEPTSAMLMLLGVAGLALRRKQRKA